MVLKFPYTRFEKVNNLNLFDINKKLLGFVFSKRNFNNRFVKCNIFNISNKNELNNKNPNDLRFTKLNKEKTEKSKLDDSNQIKVQFDDVKTENQNFKSNKEYSNKSNNAFDNKTNKNPKNDINFQKIKLEKSNASQESSDLVLIYSQQTGMKYYIYNGLILGGYVIYFWLNIFKDIPEPLFSTILVFGSLSHILFIGLFMLSNRQIRNIYLKRNTNLIIIETFSLIRIKKKAYMIDTNKIKEVRTNPLMRKMNLFYVTYKDKFGFFKVLDYFIFRPTTNTSQMFDNIFKSKLKK